MRIFSIQHFTLMTTTVVMLAYAASIHHPTKGELRKLLEAIKNEAGDLLNQSHSLEVVKVYFEKCEPKIFCKAAKSLKQTKQTFLDKLKRVLHQYNIKKENGTICQTPSNNHTCSLKSFLKDLKTCAEQALQK